jgi:hypothetical protein
VACFAAWGFHLPISGALLDGDGESIRLKIAEQERARLVQLSPALLIIAATMLAGAFFIMLPLWHHDASVYFWCGCLLISAASRGCSKSPGAECGV